VVSKAFAGMHKRQRESFLGEHRVRGNIKNGIASSEARASRVKGEFNKGIKKADEITA